MANAVEELTVTDTEYGTHEFESEHGETDYEFMLLTPGSKVYVSFESSGSVDELVLDQNAPTKTVSTTKQTVRFRLDDASKPAIVRVSGLEVG